MANFVQNNDSKPRTGVVRTRQGLFDTPIFMPDATRGAVKTLTPQELEEAGVRVVLSNTYHNHIRPGEDVIARLGGLHQFMNWSGPILTDSGGFQAFSLAKINKLTEEGVEFKEPRSGDTHMLTPENSIEIQFKLGSDIVLPLDDVVNLGADRTRTREAMERTHRWFLRSQATFNRLAMEQYGQDLSTDAQTLGEELKRPLFFGIFQGGMMVELRRQSLDYIQAQDIDGLCIGGLSVGEDRDEMYDILRDLGPHYRDDLARFLLGVGHPTDMRVALANGVDMFDCVLPTRNARHGSVWIVGDKTLNLTGASMIEDSGPIEEGCPCYTCTSGFSRAFLRHQFKVGDPVAGRLASIHNLVYLKRVIESEVSL